MKKHITDFDRFLNEAKTNELKVEIIFLSLFDDLSNVFLDLVENLKKESIELEGVGNLSQISVNKNDFKYRKNGEDYYKIKALLITNKPSKVVADKIRWVSQFTQINNISLDFRVEKILLLSDIYGLDNINPRVSKEIEVGAILCSRYQDEDTYYYCVVGNKENLIDLIQMETESISIKGWENRKGNKPTKIDRTKPVIKKKVKNHPNYGEVVVINSNELATLWDGEL